MILNDFIGLRPILYEEVPPEDGAPGGPTPEDEEIPDNDDLDPGAEDDDDTEDEEDADDHHTQNLLAALSNPATRKATILALAETEGIKLTAGTTEKQVINKAKSLAEVFEETLGDDLDLLPSKGKTLLAAIEKIIGSKVDEIKSDLQVRDNKALVNEAGKVYEKLQKDTTNYPRLKEVDQMMGQLIKQYPISDGQSIEDHMSEMYTLACRRADKSGTKNSPRAGKERDKRAIQNRERHVPSGQGGQQKERQAVNADGKMSSKDAVRAALVELQQKARAARK